MGAARTEAAHIQTTIKNQIIPDTNCIWVLHMTVIIGLVTRLDIVTVDIVYPCGEEVVI